MRRDILRRLGAGEAIDAICKEVGWTRAEFGVWWQQEAASRAPRCDGQVVTGVRSEATIERDRWGVPHIFADNPHDLWFAFGFAMAQDRLFQMDLRRRRAVGRLAEVLGEPALEADVLARTMDLPGLAAAGGALGKLAGTTNNSMVPGLTGFTPLPGTIHSIRATARLAALPKFLKSSDPQLLKF
jgi:hypothetical protein